MDQTKLTLISLALITGAANTLGFTLQNKQPVTENGIQKHFFHPYMQVTLRFVSNISVLLVYFILKHKKQNKNSNTIITNSLSQNKSKINYLIFIIPTILDYISVVCYYTALNFISGSIYQMLRGGTILTTFLFSYIFLHTRPTKQKKIGCIIVFLGLVLVGTINILLSQGSSIQKQQVLIGYGLITIALFGNGLHFVCQQYILTKFQVDPLIIIGMEGLYGVIISLIVIPILSFIPCSFQIQNCVINSYGDAVVQNFYVYLDQVFSNGVIFTGVVIVLISMAIYNTVGVIIAKQMNSITRSICDASRTILIWIVGVIVTATIGSNNKAYHWQSLNEWQLVGQSFGFVILILGNLIYYQIIKLNCFKSKQQDNYSTLSLRSSEDSIIIISQR